MKTIALYYISCFAQFSTNLAAAPPIVHPSILQLNSGILLGNLTSLANNAAPHTTLGLTPPPTPFILYVPNTTLFLLVAYTSYVHDRIERWVNRALRTAYDDLTGHPRSESISDSIAPDTYLRYNGNPDETTSESTDIELVPQQNLTYGMFVDCLGVMNWFVITYPEWDFGFNVGMEGVVGGMGRCGFVSR